MKIVAAMGKTQAIQKLLITSALGKITAAGIVEAQLLVGAELVEEEIFFERLRICSNCNEKGKVIVKAVNLQGCTVCNCPFLTKPRFKNHKNFLENKLIKTVCPLNKW